jgi:hypothetical protein
MDVCLLYRTCHLAFFQVIRVLIVITHLEFNKIRQIQDIILNNVTREWLVYNDDYIDLQTLL